MKKINLFKRFVLLLTLFLVIITLYYGITLYRSSNRSPAERVVQVVDTGEDGKKSVDGESRNDVISLQEQYGNKDIQGIISIEGEDFRYPVVQTSDNEYYLTHNYNKKQDAMGAIYADYRVSLEDGKKILIFGHSSVKRTTPFNTLENYYEEEYYQHHKYLTLETENNISRYEIFSVYVETNDFTYMNVLFDSKEEWYRHILKLQRKSLYSTDIELTEDEDILILQTCSNHPKYRNNSKKYLLIVSRRVK